MKIGGEIRPAGPDTSLFSSIGEERVRNSSHKKNRTTLTAAEKKEKKRLRNVTKQKK